MGGDKKQTVTQRLDPRSEGHVSRMRSQATVGANEILGQEGSFFNDPSQLSAIMQNMQGFMNPFTDQVIGGVNDQFDQLRAGATTHANQQASGAGAFNSARHGAIEGAAHGELGRAQAQQVGGLLSNQFNTALGQGLNFSRYQDAQRQAQLQEPIFRNQVAQGLLAGGLGPTGSTQTSITPGSFWKDAAGIGLTVGGALLGGPAGAAAGSSVGGLFSGGATNAPVPGFNIPGPGHPSLTPYRPPIARPAGF